jgi:calcium-dependent protein kinase
MELCEGGEVFERIIETGFISERTSSNIVGQVASALAYAHFRGICHRDIKPENVVFCAREPGDNRVKLIDWGLATSFIDAKMTHAVGSMTYAAPEVISSRDVKAYTQACDLWSMGCLTYVMLCGKPPFWGSHSQHYNAARNERYPFRDSPWDKMNPDAKDLVRVLLKAKPTERLPIADVVKHPWLVSPPAEGSAEAGAAVLGNLKNFCAQGAFSRIALQP